jgi:hypothetical protein
VPDSAHFMAADGEGVAKIDAPGRPCIALRFSHI